MDNWIYQQTKSFIIRQWKQPLPLQLKSFPTFAMNLSTSYLIPQNQRNMMRQGHGNSKRNHTPYHQL